MIFYQLCCVKWNDQLLKMWKEVVKDCKLSRFSCSVVQVFTLLGCYMWHSLVVGQWYFGILEDVTTRLSWNTSNQLPTYTVQHHKTVNTPTTMWWKGQRPMKIWPIGRPETPVTNYQTLPHNITEQQRPQL
jgi:hypothetical protein